MRENVLNVRRGRDPAKETIGQVVVTSLAQAAVGLNILSSAKTGKRRRGKMTEKNSRTDRDIGGGIPEILLWVENANFKWENGRIRRAETEEKDSCLESYSEHKQQVCLRGKKRKL